MLTKSDTNWNTNLDLELLKLYVGQTYSSLEEVAVAKSNESSYIRDSHHPLLLLTKGKL